MPKPTLLFASPFPPHRSGISDYSVCQVLALEEFFDITLYTDNYSISERLLTHFRVLRHGVDRIQFDRYDYRIYQIGNDPSYHSYIYEACLQHPGLIILHDLVLYFLVVGIYQEREEFYSRIFRIGGAPAVSVMKRQLKDRKDLLRFSRPETFPLNRELLMSGNDIAVHSEYTRSRIADSVPPGARVCRINHLLLEPAETPRYPSRPEVLSKLGIPADAAVVASFGFVAPTKLNDVICRAVRRLGVDNLYYIMVGEGNYVDQHLGERIRVTGFVELDKFQEYLHCCDLVMNLRHPTMGETSGALLRAMSAGKPCVVTDLGWFGELPDAAVLKLGVGDPEFMEEEVYQTLRIFLRHRDPFDRMAAVAANHVHEQHSPCKVAKEIYDLLCRRERVLAVGLG